MARYTNESIVPAALRGETAETANGNFSTEIHTYPFAYVGSMRGALKALYQERVRERKVSQVIYSYVTPIAWLDADHGWIIPSARYSSTTSTKHQSKLYRLRGTYLDLAWDATLEDARRVLNGEMRFVRNARGDAYVATVPGPNYRPETCPRHGGAWGSDDTCQGCTDLDGVAL